MRKLASYGAPACRHPHATRDAARLLVTCGTHSRVRLRLYLRGVRLASVGAWLVPPAATVTPLRLSKAVKQ